MHQQAPPVAGPRAPPLSDTTGGALSPPGAALTGRDPETLDMVANAVVKGDTFLAFQPVLALRPPHPIAFHEGLIRVLDPSGREIPARDFIDVVEPTELGRKIDCLSLEAGLKTLARVPDIRLSINMSARSIGYRPWMRVLERSLRRNPTVGERLILEITERSAISLPEVVARFMTDLQLSGIAFALDDFGAGYTSFRHFRDLDFDMVKIDGQFIQGVHATPDNAALTKALVDLARHFDMFTVAEMVEDERDTAWLAQIGVDCVQGHLYGAPTAQPPWISPRKARKHA